MPVWWGILIYMLVFSGVGMMSYNNKLQRATTVDTGNKCFNNEYQSIGLFFAFLSFALLVYFVGERSVMFDSAEYQYAYEHYYTDDLGQIIDIWKSQGTKGELYCTLLILFKHFTGNADYTSWFFFLAIIQTVSIVCFLYKYSVNFLYSVFLILTTGYTMWFVNGIRQFLAITFVLFFVDWIKDRKVIPFLLVVVVAYFIHSSAILWIPIYFIVNYEPWSSKFILLSVIFSLILFVFSTSHLLNETEYNYLYTNNYNNGVNPLRVLLMSVPCVLAFLNREKIKKQNNKLLSLWVNLSVITTECYLVGMFTTGVIGRISGYTQVFNYVLFPWMVKNIFDDDNKKMVIILSIIVLLIYFIYDMYFAGNGIYHSSNLQLYYDMV